MISALAWVRLHDAFLPCAEICVEIMTLPLCCRHVIPRVMQPIPAPCAFTECVHVQVPRGAAKRVPYRQELSLEELAAFRAKAAEEIRSVRQFSTDDSDDNTAQKRKTVAEVMADPAFASLQGVELPKCIDADDDAELAIGGAGVADGEDDLFQGDDQDDDASDAADYTARSSDVFLLAANTEEDFSSLEVYCYNTEDGSLYVHHDITLPAFPLSLAWMDYAGESASQLMIAQSGSTATPESFIGSYVAVGTFKTDIEIWNLDVIDPLEPSLVLKGVHKGAQSRKPGKSETNAGHSDAVMGLSWNKVHRHMLASGSADKTVKLWDLDTARVLHTFTHHIGKVQSVTWNPRDSTVLAAASFDRTISLLDAREGDKARVARYSLPSDSECLTWNIHHPEHLIAACDDGTVLQYDARVPDVPLWSFKAHAGATTCVSLSALAQGLMATSSLDRCVKLWDWNTLDAGGNPCLIASKEMSIGQIFSVNFFPHSAFLLAAAGSKGLVAIWDISMDAGEVPGFAPAIAEGAAESSAVPAAASHTARRFADRIVDPNTVEALSIRPRPDGQPLSDD
jgi:periodic tryptophan protein 1